MERAFYPIEWLIEKYGQPIQPWVYNMRFENINGDRCGQWKKTASLKNLSYRFAVASQHHGIEWERDPPRTLSIANPEVYFGQVGSTRSIYQQNSNQIFVVNGSAQVSHGNFIGDFEANQVPGQSIFVGNLPSSERHVNKLVSQGVTAILNLSTDTPSQPTLISRISLIKQHPIRDGISFLEDLF